MELRLRAASDVRCDARRHNNKGIAMNIRKSVLITSMLAALAVVSLPAVASAQTYGYGYGSGTQCYGYNCPQPRPQRPHRRPSIEVQVQVWEQVPVQVATFEWRWDWRWDSSCGRMNWVWAQIQVGTRTEYQWRQVNRWVTATWDAGCHKYVYWHNGARYELDSQAIASRW
jgi:hypothetical protein